MHVKAVRSSQVCILSMRGKSEEIAERNEGRLIDKIQAERLRALIVKFINIFKIIK